MFARKQQIHAAYSSVEDDELLVLGSGDGLLHDSPGRQYVSADEEQLHHVLGEPAHQSGSLLSRRHRHGLGVTKVPEHQLRHSVPGLRELPRDGLVVRLPRPRRRHVELHVAEHEHFPHHPLRGQAAGDGHAEELVEHRLEVGVHAPVHLADEPGLLRERVALDAVKLRPRAEGDDPVAPRLVAELGEEEAERDADLHGETGHAVRHVAHGDAVAELSERQQVRDHALPLQVRYGAAAGVVDGLKDLVREQRARRDLGLPGLDVGEVEAEALGVVLEEEVLVVLHGHGGHALVRHGPPRACRDEDLGEHERAAQRHQHLLAETVARAVGIVRVRQVRGELRLRALGEEAARDGLADEGGAVVALVQRRAPFRGEREVVDLAVDEIPHVHGKEVGEHVRSAVVQEAVVRVPVVPLDGSGHGFRALPPALHGGLGGELPVALEAGSDALLASPDDDPATLERAS
ncbi:hypothetical protein ACQ4PT_010454 [Festuca glaucescens]